MFVLPVNWRWRKHFTQDLLSKSSIHGCRTPTQIMPVVQGRTLLCFASISPRNLLGGRWTTVLDLAHF